MQQQNIRNIAIIAHVDHGKTTLVDAMLKQTKTFAAHQKELQQTTILDSNDLERERGVTILSKNTAVFWQDLKINILDTPGHADFSGEVERVLNMADGCILLVDAAEGVLSQTKFVLKLALELKLTPIVVINKVDKKNQRIEAVQSEVENLFLELATDDSQLDFPVLYASGIAGIAGQKLSENADHSLEITDSADLAPLFELLQSHINSPTGDTHAPLQLQVNSLDWDNHLGKIVVGRIFRGTIAKGDRVAIMDATGQKRAEAKVEHLFTHHGLERSPAAELGAGEIVAISGMPDPKIGETIAALSQPEALPILSISEPTVKMQFSVNTSPFSGRDAEFSTSRQVRDRLTKELETNVGLRMEKEAGDAVTVVGRGELHLSILIETMRREGYEFSVSRPQVVIKKIDDKTLEPWESVTIQVPDEYTGTITTSMAQRQGQLKNMTKVKDDVFFEYEIATANLIGYRNDLLTSTSGTGVVQSSFLEFRGLTERAPIHRGGAIVAWETGRATAYALEKAQQRGSMLVDPSEEVYAGQVVGINSRSEDMWMNVTKGKKLTNVRAASADATVVLAPAWKPSLEQYLTIVGEDEMLEVTPKFLRLRKRKLTQ